MAANLTDSNELSAFPCPGGKTFGIEGVVTNTSCGNRSFENAEDEYINPFDVTYIRVVFITLYILVFACCFFGNCVVIFVVLRHRKMRTITNFFLANLAVADLCVGIFCVLPNLSQNLVLHWLLGQVMCKVYYFVQTMSYTASVTILTVISIERYFAIIHPIRSKLKTTVCLLRSVVVLVWFVAACCGAPFLVLYDVIQIPTNHNTFQICVLVHEFNIRAYITINFILWYVLPLILMSVMYAKISIVLWRSSHMGNLEKKKRVRFKKPDVGKSDNKNHKTLTVYKRTERIEEHCFYDFVRKVGQHGQNQHPCGTGHSVPHTISDPEYSECEYDDSLKQEYDIIYNPVDYEDDWPSSTPKGPNVFPPNHNFGNTSYISPNTKIFTFSTNASCETKSHSNSKKPGGYRHISCMASKTTPQPKPDPKEKSALLARRKVIRLLIAIIVSFSLCTLPYHIRILWQFWGWPRVSFGERLIPPITFITYYLNSGLNPILYAFLSDNFRRSLREVFHCRSEKRQHEQFQQQQQWGAPAGRMSKSSTSTSLKTSQKTI